MLGGKLILLFMKSEQGLNILVRFKNVLFVLNELIGNNHLVFHAKHYYWGICSLSGWLL